MAKAWIFFWNIDIWHNIWCNSMIYFRIWRHGVVRNWRHRVVRNWRCWCLAGRSTITIDVPVNKLFVLFDCERSAFCWSIPCCNATVLITNVSSSESHWTKWAVNEVQIVTNFAFWSLLSTWLVFVVNFLFVCNPLLHCASHCFRCCATGVWTIAVISPSQIFISIIVTSMTDVVCRIECIVNCISG